MKATPVTKTNVNRFRIQFAGEAGDGILTAGDIFMQALAQAGYWASVLKSFPSNIRGGYASSLVTISADESFSPSGSIQVLFAFNAHAIEESLDEIEYVEFVVLENSISSKYHEALLRKVKNPKKIIHAPVASLAMEAAQNPQTRSVVGLGIAAYCIGLDKEIIYEQVQKHFSNKGPSIAVLNVRALDSAYKWCQENCKTFSVLSRVPKVTSKRKRIVLEGNQAASFGAVAAGCTFFGSYPITPATTIGDSMAKILPLVNGFAYQAEDELSAIGTVIGASFSGAKAMTATSGPGLSLMQEFIGYASMIELPIVIIDVQRVGPSTGMPTKHGQDDLLAACFGGHGEGQRIVVAPGSVENCLTTVVEAFSLAEKYQCPVIVLSDAALGMMKKTTFYPNIKNLHSIYRSVISNKEPNDSNYHRYSISKNGINPIAVPGISKVTYRVTGVEHDQDSRPLHSRADRERQHAKRYRKIEHLETQVSKLIEWDLEPESNTHYDFVLSTWGITTMVAKEAIEILRLEGFKIGAMYSDLVFPVCKDAFTKLLEYSTLLFMPESNYTGQYANLVRMFTNAQPISITQSTGEPLTPKGIAEPIRQYFQQHRATVRRKKKS